MFTINHIKLETINSTNDYTLSLKESNVFKEGLVVTANYQSGGYGQRGKIWQSNANENLLLSVIIEPNIKIDEQFLISKIVSLFSTKKRNRISLICSYLPYNPCSFWYK